MNVPTALASAKEAAASVVSVVREHHNRFFPPKPVFAVWVGDAGVANAEFEAAGIPAFQSESDAVRGFMHLIRYRTGLDALMATPPSLPTEFSRIRRPPAASCSKRSRRGGNGSTQSRSAL